MFKRPAMFAAAGLFAAVAWTGTAHATTIGINFTNNTGGIEAGFENYVWGSGNTISNTSDTFATALGQSGDITIALTNSDARMRSASGGPAALNDLAQGFLFTSQTITLTDLNPGLYEITTYHHDRDNSVVAGMRFDLTGADGGVFRQSQATAGGGTNPVQTNSFQFVVDNTGTATIAITSFGSGPGGPLNAFELTDATTAPNTMAVDFGPTTTTHVAPGFVAWRGGPHSNVNAPFADTQSFVYADAQNQFVTMDVTMNGSDNRATDRSGSDPLHRDVLMTNGDTIGLTLSNLLAGTYDLTLFHGTDGGSFSGLVDVFIDGALMGSFAQQPFGQQDFLAIESDGVNPLLIEYKKAQSGAPSFLHLAGLQLSNFQPLDTGEPGADVIPEPATALLSGMAGLLLLRRRRREA